MFENVFKSSLKLFVEIQRTTWRLYHMRLHFVRNVAHINLRSELFKAINLIHSNGLFHCRHALENIRCCSGDWRAHRFSNHLLWWCKKRILTI